MTAAGGRLRTGSTADGVQSGGECCCPPAAVRCLPPSVSRWTSWTLTPERTKGKAALNPLLGSAGSAQLSRYSRPSQLKCVISCTEDTVMSRVDRVDGRHSICYDHEDGMTER